MSRLIRIFDTTLRDGEQCPGASMNVEEKFLIARQLARLGVDVIEAGFAFSSPGDFEAVQRIGREVKGPIICSLARARPEDIDRAWEALKTAHLPRIHTFISTSDIHLRYQFRMSREQALEQAMAMVKRAKGYLEDVEFSPMDASRSDPEYLYRVIEAVIRAGATTVNIPDTVGCALPEEFGALIRNIREHVPATDRIVLSVHCHNDLGLAVANSLAAIRNGAGQVECTVNGIGERAGNASLEEIVMTLRTRREFFQADTRIVTEEIIKTSRMVSGITGLVVQPNKAIVGDNAFAHESGIHQDGLLKERLTYEIITPASIGLGKSKLVMGKHSGRHAFKTKLEEMGYGLSEEDLNKAFARFKKLADQKKEVFEEDIEAIIADEIYKIPETYTLRYLHVSSGTEEEPTATIRIEVGGELVEKMGKGDGPVDATYKTIASITKTESRLLNYAVKAITGGTDALGEVTVHLEEDGKKFIGHGSDTDIIVASAKAYINALNKLAYWKKRREEKATDSKGLI